METSCLDQECTHKIIMNDASVYVYMLIYMLCMCDDKMCIYSYRFKNNIYFIHISTELYICCWLKLCVSLCVCHAIGVKNVTMLGTVIQWQKVSYDFRYYNQDFATPLAFLILSEAESFLPVGHCVCCVVAYYEGYLYECLSLPPLLYQVSGNHKDCVRNHLMLSCRCEPQHLCSSQMAPIYQLKLSSIKVHEL